MGQQPRKMETQTHPPPWGVRKMVVEKKERRKNDTKSSIRSSVVLVSGVELRDQKRQEFRFRKRIIIPRNWSLFCRIWCHRISTKKCLVIDLDETLVHSSFKPISNADFIVPVEIDGTIHQVYVLKRPYVDEFLKKVGGLYECVLFTASLAKYADPVTDLLDKWDVFRARLFRESCVFHRGNYVKDLGRLGRDLGQIIILDNSPASYIFHPENAVPCTSWFDDMENKELLELTPFFEQLSKAENIYTVLKAVQPTGIGQTQGAGPPPSGPPPAPPLAQHRL